MRKLILIMLIALALPATAALTGSAQATPEPTKTLKCADVVYRYHDVWNYKLVATEITARGVICRQARHLGYDAVRALRNAYKCPTTCDVPKRLDGFTLRWHHILSDLRRVTATRGAATVKFTIYRT